ncbi:hypothetical protein IAU59_003529 [Kwoniella sp. CBS 9459]
MSYPYLAKTTLKYKSPHSTDLSFAKDETIRVTGPSPDDEDWLVGETLDGSRSGGFPKDFVTPVEGETPSEAVEEPSAPKTATTAATSSTSHPEPASAASQSADAPAPMPPAAKAPPSPKLEPSNLPPSSAVTPTPAQPAAESAPALAPATSQAAGDSPPRPQSMKDRLAFFTAAQTKAPPPPIKPKPATGGLTWSQRQKLRQEQEAKERDESGSGFSAASAPPSAPSAPAPTSNSTSTPPQPTPIASDDTKDKDGKEGTGMSAADALSSISKGGSLKERMAALKGQGAFGSGSNPGESAETAPPPVSSGKVWKRPPAPPAPEPEPESESSEIPPASSQTNDGDIEEAPGSEKVKSPIAEGGDALAEEGGHQQAEEEEEDEAEKEKARRAAIAARMAKLGARGPMGMMAPGPAPPKPARKPTKEPESATATPVEEKKEPAVPVTADANTAPDAPEGSTAKTAPADSAAGSAAPEPAAPPKSVPIAAMPRRTAPPRRRGPAASSAPPAPAASSTSPEVARQDPIEAENRFEGEDKDGAPTPPPQVMVAGEEDALPKTEAGQQKEAQDEERGKGVGGLEGAAAAGIALAPVGAAEQATEDKPIQQLEPQAEGGDREPLVGAVGHADAEDRGTGTITTRDGEGEIVDNNAPVQEVEEGVEEGGDEKDDIMREAQRGQLDFKTDETPPLEECAPTPLSPDPIGMVPLHPPAPEGADYDEDEPPPPPPRKRGMSLDIPLDELERKHELEHAHAIDRSEHAIVTEEDDDQEPDDIPPPPPRRTSVDKPLGPRPLPSPGKANPLPPPPTGNPLVPPRDEDEDEDDGEEAEEEAVPDSEGAQDEDEGEDEIAPPLPPHRHATQSSDAADDEEDQDEVAPPPPPARSIPRPAQESEDGEEEEDEQTAPPPPPARQLPAAIRPEEEAADSSAPPPPARQPSMPAPLQMGVPIPASGAAPKSPVTASPNTSKSQIVASPTKSRTLVEEPTSSPTGPAEDEDASRRSGIAARMAKLGGIKFGMPPPTFKKPSASVTSPTNEHVPGSPKARNVDEPTSPIDTEPPVRNPSEERSDAMSSVPSAPAPAPAPAPAFAESGDSEETPEQEAARRRATLARLRAGGALGFGMFNHGLSADEPREDARGLEEETTQDAASADAEEDDAPPPPPPPGRPAVPAGRPMPTPPAQTQDEDEEETDEPAPPPPPARPVISTAVSAGAAPASPLRMPQSPSPSHPSPVRSPSGRRPPVPTEKRFSQTHIKRASTSSAFIPEDRPSSGTDWQLADEPAVMMANQSPSQSHFPETTNEEEEQEAPPPPPPTRPPPPPAQESSPRRSMSIASRLSRKSTDIPPATPSKAAPQQQQQIPQSPVQAHPSPARQSSVGQGVGRPGFDQLKEASSTAGVGLARAAQGMFAQGKKAYFGEGSPAGFVLVAMDHAHIPRPQQGWGQIIFEQEGGSILRRYDEPRPGDIAAFHDAKLKGKKGLSTYNQHVGSVEEPLVGVVAEFEDRKHKLRVLQVERGTPEEVSYRCEDLKSGKIVVYRPGI